MFLCLLSLRKKRKKINLIIYKFWFADKKREKCRPSVTSLGVALVCGQKARKMSAECNEPRCRIKKGGLYDFKRFSNTIFKTSKNV